MPDSDRCCKPFRAGRADNKSPLSGITRLFAARYVRLVNAVSWLGLLMVRHDIDKRCSFVLDACPSTALQSMS